MLQQRRFVLILFAAVLACAAACFVQHPTTETSSLSVASTSGSPVRVESTPSSDAYPRPMWNQQRSRGVNRLSLEGFLPILLMLEESQTPLTSAQRTSLRQAFQRYGEAARREGQALGAIYACLRADQRQQFLIGHANFGPGKSGQVMLKTGMQHALAGSNLPDPLEASVQELITLYTSKAGPTEADVVQDDRFSLDYLPCWNTAATSRAARFTFLNGLSALESQPAFALTPAQSRTALNNLKIVQRSIKETIDLESGLGLILTSQQAQTVGKLLTPGFRLAALPKLMDTYLENAGRSQ